MLKEQMFTKREVEGIKVEGIKVEGIKVEGK
jgi:hypothetical protein